MKRLRCLLCVAALLLCSTACSRQTETDTGDVPVVTTPSSLGISADELFSDRDQDPSYDAGQAITVTLNGTGATATSAAVTSANGVVTLTAASTYVLSGELDGQLIVDAPKDDKLQLVLQGVTVRCEHSSALYIRQADKVFLTLADGTTNALTSSGDFVDIDENSLDAAVFSKDDLTINGGGALTVTCETAHGIVSKDDLTITGGQLTVTAAKHGLCAKDRLDVSGGTFTVEAGKDGVHAENKDDETLGALYLAGGTWNVTADGDGFQAAASLQIDSGTYTITTGGGSQNASTDSDWGQWGGSYYNTQATDNVSAKGIKCSGDILVNGGKFFVNSSDDSLHSNASLYIIEGEFTLSSGDDGIHADTAVLISGGTITVTQSYEGIEAQSITISGGTIDVTASDDGINAAGGNDGSAMGGRPGQGNFNADTSAFLSITGGKITINAGGDGIDSNGALYVSGGETYVSGPTDNGNGALDYETDAVATGGIVVAAGSSGMAVGFGSSSTQACILCNVGSCAAGTAVELRDAKGNVLASFTPTKAFSSVAITAPGLEEDADCTLVVGSQTYELTLDGYQYGNSGGMMGGDPGSPGNSGGFGGQGGMPNGGGGRPGGRF